MSEPLTAEEIEDIRRIHVEDTSGECCAADENYWPCDSARLLATLDAAREGQGLAYWRDLYETCLETTTRLAREGPGLDVETRQLIRELAEAYHVHGLIRDHADVSDRTGWNVRGIESCGDPLCVAAQAAQQREGAGE